MTDYDVIIVGSGFSGIAMARSLLKQRQRSFVVLEKAEQVGGTWRDNHYPGCACDVPSHLYSFSFALNPDWSRMFAPQPEILAYLERCADELRVREHIRFGAEVQRVELDEAARVWHVHVAGGRVLTARSVVLGVGAFDKPIVPTLPGLERFSGEAFHSARWPSSFNADGKRLAVIGTGASAIQFVPQVAKQAARVHLFQRTPPWVMPKPDFEFSPAQRRRFRERPWLMKALRSAIYWWMETRGLGFTVSPKVMKLAALGGKEHIKKQIRDPELRARVTPDYMPGCKRILIANDYYPTLERANVELVSDGVERVTERSVVTRDGTERDVDAILFGTGFGVTDILTPLVVVGRRRRELNEVWAGGIEAHLGTTISGFPNLFILFGPNTGLGHNSMVFMIESQVRYVMNCLQTIEARGARQADVRAQAQARFNAALAPRLARSVWAAGCQSWYLDERGRNPTIWPGFTFEYWWKTRRMNPADYELDTNWLESASGLGARS